MERSSEHGSSRLDGQALPPGCSYGRTENGDDVIWVDFPPNSPLNPFLFSPTRKRIILSLGLFYSFIASVDMGVWSTGSNSMSRDLQLNSAQVSAGVAIFVWGFAVAPLLLAPISEEFGRRYTYIIAVILYWQFHLTATLGRNLETLIIGRFLQGAAASIGAALVAGTITDIYQPDDRGHPMTMFGVACWLGSGLGPVTLCWVEANPKLEWRWIHWIQYIILGVYAPLIIFFMPETRAPQILKSHATALQRLHGDEHKRPFLTQGDMGSSTFMQRLQSSIARPIKFLIFEPIVTFFSIWVALGWGVLFVMFNGVAYIFGNIYGFGVTGSGLVFNTLVIAAGLGYAIEYLSARLYQKNRPKYGPEARLYTPMASGIAFAIGCYILGFTGRSDIHWIVPCIGIVVLMTAVLNIYIVSFTYLADCYGSQASSALAAQSFLRNMFGGAFSMFTKPMFDTMTPQWAIFTFGSVAGVLAVVPFVAFWKGPQIRAKSKLSKELMQEEARRVAQESRRLDLQAGVGDDPGDTSKALPRQLVGGQTQEKKDEYAA